MKYALIDGDYNVEGVLEEVKILESVLDEDGVLVIDNVFDQKCKEALLSMGAEVDPKESSTFRIIK